MINFIEIETGLNEFERIRNEIVLFNGKIQSEYNPDDIRFYFPNQLNRALIYNNLNLNYFQSTIIIKEKLDGILFTPSAKDHYAVIENYLSMCRLNLVYSLCIVLERYIRKICAELKIGKSGDIIRRLREELFKEINISQEDALWKAQSILFNIRNTNHNNGLHTQADSVIKYRGRQYPFLKNMPHSSADFATLCKITRDVFTFYKSTLVSKKLQQISLIQENLEPDYFKLFDQINKG